MKKNHHVSLGNKQSFLYRIYARESECNINSQTIIRFHFLKSHRKHEYFQTKFSRTPKGFVIRFHVLKSHRKREHFQTKFSRTPTGRLVESSGLNVKWSGTDLWRQLYRV